MRGKLKTEFFEDTRETDYETVKSKFTTKSRLDLNDLLKRVEDQKKNDKKINYLILSSAALVAVVVLLILSL